jgi:hypothetical protein
MRILCLDFDGVLHAYTSGWQGVEKVADGPTPGAMAFLREAAKTFQVHIFSSRSGSANGVQAMKAALYGWLRADGMDEGDAETFVEVGLCWPTAKPSAFLTIDDRALCFKGEFPALETLHNFKTWVEVNNESQRSRTDPAKGR